MTKSKTPASAATAVAPIAKPMLLTIPQAAEALSCTKWAVRELLWAKKIPFIQIGRRWLISPADLKTFIQQQKGFAA